MHRSNFRQRRITVSPAEGQPRPSGEENRTLREQIKNLNAVLDSSLAPLKESVERLADPKRVDRMVDQAAIADLGKKMMSVSSALIKFAEQQKKVTSILNAILQMSEQERAQSAALLKQNEKALNRMTDSMRKIAGEDSSFSLSQSLQKLIFVLSSRKYRIKRDVDGNMVELETKVDA